LKWKAIMPTTALHRKGKSRYFPTPGEGFQAWWRSRSPFFQFTLCFVGVLAALGLATRLPFFLRLVDDLVALDVVSSNTVLHWLGENSRYVGATLGTGQQAILTVLRACAGTELVAIYAAAVLAFPARPLAKVVGVVGGGLLVLALNFVRITTMYLVGVHFPDAFDAIHEGVWTVLWNIALISAVAVWISWTWKRDHPETHLDVKRIAVIFLRFILVYTLLVLPWPTMTKAGCAYFRYLGTMFYATDNAERTVSFERGDRSYYTRIVIFNKDWRSQLNLVAVTKPGEEPERHLDLDTRAAFLEPIALLIALIVCTPLPWKRREEALLWGLLSLQAVLIAGLGFAIWNDATEIGLTELSPWENHLAQGVADAMVGPVPLAAPILIWLLVTFRREDVEAIAKSLTSHSPKL
jgi:exosortase/archaeosortase family protein